MCNVVIYSIVIYVYILYIIYTYIYIHCFKSGRLLSKTKPHKTKRYDLYDKQHTADQKQTTDNKEEAADDQRFFPLEK